MDNEKETVELRGPEPFPHDIQPRPHFSAYDLAQPLIAGPQAVHFALSNDRTAKFLRDLADKIDRHEVILQAGRVLTQATRDDYATTVFRLTFHEKAPAR